MASVAVVLACFNRRELTLRCLESLQAQTTDRLKFTVYLFDDGSTDGTSEAVSDLFPEVHILKGDGNAYWGGGMFAAMTAALKEEFDFLLWLNDDVRLTPTAVQSALDAYQEAVATDGASMHVIIGPVNDPDTGECSYTGFRRLSTWHPAKLGPIPPQPGKLTPCDTMNGNFVLYPESLVRKLGTVDTRLVQQMGDIDYGYRSVKAGAKLWIAPVAVGTCARGERPKRWHFKDTPLPKRLKILNSVLGYPLKPWTHFMWKHGGAAAVAAFWLKYLRELRLAIFPCEPHE